MIKAWKDIDKKMTEESNRNWHKMFALMLQNEYPDAAAYWMRLVKTGGEWDHKPGLAEDIAHALGKTKATGDDLYLPIPDNPNYVLYYDVWSNIHYGYVSNLLAPEFILSEGAARLGGGYDEADEVSIQIGYELSSKYPGGTMSEGAITKAIVEHLDDYITAAFHGYSQLRWHK